MKRATIDIGSNSILLLIAEMSSDGIHVLENHSHVTGLGRDLDKNGKFLEVAMDESFEVLKAYKDICVDNGIHTSDVIVTATEASRVASNANAFIDRVKSELDFKIIVLTGDGEAYYSTAGILIDKNINAEKITIMDIGGASTELICVNTKTKEIETSFSMPVGAVRMNNWKEELVLDKKLSEVFSKYSSDIGKVVTDKLYCVAGTMTSVGNIYLGHKDFVEQEVNGLEFTKNDLVSLRNKHASKSIEKMLEMYPFLGKRAKTIHSGIELALAIMEKVGNNDIYISTYGLRFGTLLMGEVKNEFIVDR